jgi:hypothetical protein
LAVKATEALVLVVAALGAEVIVVVGAVVSTVSERVAGLASVLPAASVARTATVWAPSLNAAVVHGLLHAAQAPLSTRQANVPASLEVNA